MMGYFKFSSKTIQQTNKSLDGWLDGCKLVFSLAFRVNSIVFWKHESRWIDRQEGRKEDLLRQNVMYVTIHYAYYIKLIGKFDILLSSDGWMYLWYEFDRMEWRK